MAKKKMKTDLQIIKDSYDKVGIRYKIELDEYDYFELIVEDEDNYVSYYFDEFEKYIQIQKCYSKITN